MSKVTEERSLEDLNAILDELTTHRKSLFYERQRTCAQIDILASENNRLRQTDLLECLHYKGTTSKRNKPSAMKNESSPANSESVASEHIIRSLGTILGLASEARSQLALQTSSTVTLLMKLFKLKTGVEIDVLQFADQLGHLNSLSANGDTLPSNDGMQETKSKQSTKFAEKSAAELGQRWSLFWESNFAQDKSDVETSGIISDTNETPLNDICKRLVRLAIQDDKILVEESSITENIKTSSEECESSLLSTVNKADRLDGSAMEPSWIDELRHTDTNPKDSRGSSLLESHTYINEVIFEESNEFIRAASIDTLILLMTHPHKSYVHVRDVFLFTYRKFISPMDLLKKIVRRFFNTVEANSDSQDDFGSQYIATVQIKVLGFLKVWLDGHFGDFQDAKSLIDHTRQFLRYMQTHRDASGPWAHKSSASLLKLLTRKTMDGYQSKKSVLVSTVLPPSILPPGGVARASFRQHKHDTMDTACLMNPIEIARQFALIDQQIFCAIQASECLSKAWSKPDRRLRDAPNIWAMIQRFEQTVEWATTQIVIHESISDRVLAIEWCISVSTEMLRMQNFHGAYSFFMALSSAPVKRLKRSMALLTLGKQQAFEELSFLFRPDRSCHNMRLAMADALAPCIPHLGIFLGDLTVIEEFDSKINGTMINFRKCRKLAGIIECLIEYQTQNYEFRPVAALAEHLKALPRRLSRKDAMLYSKRNEPRTTKKLAPTQ